MSAFVVSDKHINTLVTWATQHQVYVWDEKKDEPVRFVGHEQEIATTLLAENVRSVNARYKEREPVQPIKYKPEYIASDSGDWKARQILNACGCYNYQACETDDWEQTMAYRIIQGIKAKAIELLTSDPKLAYEIR